MSVGFQKPTACAVLGFVAASLHGCGGGGGGDGPAPGPAPAPPAKVAPDPSTMKYTIPDHTKFNCIKAKGPSPDPKYAHGFFMYRWTSKVEATTNTVNSDDLGDINPYYLLTELMTNLGSNPLSSKAGGCAIPKCGQNPADGGCVLERNYIEMNQKEIQDILVADTTWGQYMAIDNGIPSQYPYWAFNWTDRPGPCKENVTTSSCNFYFSGGYPVGCQAKSDVMDTPIWYSTIAGCPQYPFDVDSVLPRKVSESFQWHPKMDMKDPAVQQCYREMPGGNYCGGVDEKGNPKGSPWTNPSKTCTWQAKSAGYLVIEDVLDIPQPMTYHDWCLKQPDDITGSAHNGYMGQTGIPSNVSLFYNLSEIAFPPLQTVTTKMWHDAASSDNGQLSDDQKAVFKNWAKFAKVRLNSMFDEMDKQAFAKFKQAGVTDPTGQSYEGCLSNKDVTTPQCTNGLPGWRPSSSAPDVVV